MIRAALLGLAAGARAATPPAALALAAARNILPPGARVPTPLARPGTAGALLVLAVGELVGDKLPATPDRVSPVAFAGRILSGAGVGAAVAPPGRWMVGAAVGGTTAGLATLATWAGRRAGAARIGAGPAALLEDAATVLLSAAALRA